MSLSGGRISTLVVRACTFPDGGRMSLRSTTGSGLELVELRGGRFEFFGSAVRHIAFSTAAHGGDTKGAAQINLRAVGSLIAQTWIGTGVGGVATIRDCNIFDLVNAGHLDIDIDEHSNTQGLVGVKSLRTPLLDQTIAKAVSQTDYQRNPAKVAAAEKDSPKAVDDN
jgi:hypothetical protein